MGIKHLLALSLLSFGWQMPAALASESATRSYSQQQLLKNWALSACLAKAYPGEQAKEDAQVTASAYLEFGKAPIKAFEEGSALVAKFLAREYSGSVKSDFNTMKCIDLFYSPEVERWINKYVGSGRKKSGKQEFPG